MKKQIYSIYDNVAGMWLDPFYATNKATAQRTFSDACNDERSQFNKHPDDYVLYHVGVWDDRKGTIEPNETNENEGKANDYLRAV